MCHSNKPFQLVLFTSIFLFRFVTFSPAQPITDSDWAGIGGNTTNQGTIYAIAVDHSDPLYVGGRFDDILGVPAKNMARWSKKTGWSEIGTGLFGGADDIVTSLALDGNACLFAAGKFTFNDTTIPPRSLVVWNGFSWSPIPLSDKGTINEIITDNLGGIYAGGTFSTIGGITAYSLAYWDGTQWSPVSGLDSTTENVTKMAFDDESGQLIIIFQNGNCQTVARRNPPMWFFNDMCRHGPIGAMEFISTDSVAIAGWDPNAGQVLYICTPNTIHLWTAPSYASVALNDVYTLHSNHSGTLMIGGNFSSSCRCGMKIWNGESMDTAFTGTSIRTLTQDINGELFAGGDKTLKKLTGSGWVPIGGGMRLRDTIFSIVIDKNGNLYAGGTFSFAGGVSARNVARWDGYSWHPLGKGLVETVSTLALNSKGELFAATRAIGTGGVHRWTDAEWEPIPDAYYSHPVLELCIDKSDGMYITTTASFFQWNTTDWMDLDAPSLPVDKNSYPFLDRFHRIYVTSLKNVYVKNDTGWALFPIPSPMNQRKFGCCFDTGQVMYWQETGSMGSLTGHTIYRWDGQTVSNIGFVSNNNGTSDYGIRVLAVDAKHRLFVGGHFPVIHKGIDQGSITVNGLGMWDGEWHATGSGFQYSNGSSFQPGSVNTLCWDDQGNMYVGGAFDRAAGKSAQAFALLKNVDTSVSTIVLPVTKSSTVKRSISISVTALVLTISGIDDNDRISLYSIDGRMIRSIQATEKCSLRGLAHGPLVVCIHRENTIMTTRLLLHTGGMRIR